MIGDFLAGIRFDHDYENFLRAQETAGQRDQVLPIVPDSSAAYTMRYLAQVWICRCPINPPPHRYPFLPLPLPLPVPATHPLHTPEVPQC